MSIDFSSQKFLSIHWLPHTISRRQTGHKKRCSELRTRKIRDDDDGWGKFITMTNCDHQERSVDQRLWCKIKIPRAIEQSTLCWLQDELSGVIVSILVVEIALPQNLIQNTHDKLIQLMLFDDKARNWPKRPLTMTINSDRWWCKIKIPRAIEQSTLCWLQDELSGVIVSSLVVEIALPQNLIQSAHD